MEYLRKCKVLELFYTGREANQEPQFIFPLAFGKGKLKYIEEPLYKRMKYLSDNPSVHHSYLKDYEESKQYWTGFLQQLRKIVKQLPLSDNEKQHLNAAGEISYFGKILADAETFGNKEDYQDAFDYYFEFVRRYYYPKILDKPSLIDALLFLAAVEDNALSVKPKPLPSLSRQIIAWGALGKHAKPVLGYIKGTTLAPTELWDLRGDGDIVKKPDISRLTSDDMVLILTKLPVNTAAIIKALKKSDCTVVTYNDIIMYLAKEKFPMFYDGRCNFKWK